MKKFVKNTIWFLLPIISFLLVPVISLWSYKENFYNIDEVIQTGQPKLIGYAYNEKNYKYLKYKSIEQGPQQDILAVGSSRSLQFRSEMFSQKFYNAGYTITNIKDFLPFLKLIPKEKHPEVLIINLDQWMFNKTFDPLKANPNKTQWTDAFTEYPDYNTIMGVWKDIFNKKYPIINPNTDKKYGLNAVVNNKGFRKDGSMFYGNQIEKLISNDSTANDYQFKDTFKRIKNGDNRFEYGNDFNKETLPIIEELLRYCNENNIKLIAYLPPYAPDVYEKLKASGNYKFMDSIYKELQPYFQEYNAEVFDFSNGLVINSNNEEFVDGFHGGEKTYARMLLKMLENQSVLKEYVNADVLVQQINGNKNPLILYPEG